MATTIKNARPKTERTFVGRAWLNTTKDGRSYFNIKIDRKVSISNVDDSCTFQLWPNTKREGKKDADYRLSVLTPVSE